MTESRTGVIASSRGDYLRAVEDMVERTDHELSRWQLVEGDYKHYARVKVIETVISRGGARDARARLPGAAGALAPEQRQVGLALALEHGEIDLDAGDPA